MAGIACRFSKFKCVTHFTVIQVACAVTREAHPVALKPSPKLIGATGNNGTLII